MRRYGSEERGGDAENDEPTGHKHQNPIGRHGA
jgi:hypothetical protein